MAAARVGSTRGRPPPLAASPETSTRLLQTRRTEECRVFLSPSSSSSPLVLLVRRRCQRRRYGLGVHLAGSPRGADSRTASEARRFSLRLRRRLLLLLLFPLLLFLLVRLLRFLFGLVGLEKKHLSFWLAPSRFAAVPGSSSRTVGEGGERGSKLGDRTKDKTRTGGPSPLRRWVKLPCLRVQQ